MKGEKLTRKAMRQQVKYHTKWGVADLADSLDSCLDALDAADELNRQLVDTVAMYTKRLHTAEERIAELEAELQGVLKQERKVDRYTRPGGGSAF